MSASSPQQRRVVFTGRVQGVGFRYTTQRIAKRIGLSGWVRNRDDGRVEMIAEGMPDEIDRLVEGLRDHFGLGIESLDSQTLPAEGAGSDFRIRY